MKFRKCGIGIAASLMTIGMLTIPALAEENVQSQNPIPYTEELPAPVEEKHVTGIELSQTQLTFQEPGATAVLKATVAPEDADNKALSWNSSNEAVAVVDENGTVTAKANGTALITVSATDGSGVYASCEVTVDIRNGICPDAQNGNILRYYKNGVVDTSCNSVEPYGDTWYKVTNGTVDTSYNGLADNAYGTWLIQNGKVNFGLNGLVSTSTGWWKIKSGAVDKTFTGLTPNQYGWWRVENGKINFNYNGVAANEYGWWKITGGAVDFNFTGLAANEYGWWYLRNGCVDFTRNGIEPWNGAWWRIEGGNVNFNFNGVAPNEYGWWKFSGGHVDFTFNGIAPNEYGWWKFSGGSVDFGFRGIAQNDLGWWYLNRGCVDFGYTGTAYIGGTMCQVVGGHVQLHTKDVYVSDRNSGMYGKTLRLYYDVNGKLMEDVSGVIGGNHTYELYVNKAQNMVTVYTTDGGVYIPVKRFICSGGNDTPLGTFYTPAKYRWQALMLDSWGQWCTRIQGGVLFHSVYYNSANNNQNLSVSAYNKLGQTASHGCIRLTAGDAKWIYDNCPLGTKVTIYYNWGYEPFSKPTAYKLPSWHKWDPTDPTMYWKCQQNGCH